MALRRIKLPEMNPEIVTDEIGNFVIGVVLGSSSTGAVIGLSGGVDSTVTADLVKKAFDKYNQTHKHLELVGYILPSKINDPKDTRDGIEVAERLGIRYETHSLEPIIDAFNITNPEIAMSSYDLGNLISRIRANVLSTKAASERKTLIGTGNKDEDFGIGYYTMFGDGAVFCSPIGNLSKRLVFQMARHHGFGYIADKEPAAGLETGQTDFKDLCYRYNAVEIVLEGISQGVMPEELPSLDQIKEIIMPQLKGNPKFKTVDEVVGDILFRHYQIALPKQEIIHPPAAPVTLIYR